MQNVILWLFYCLAVITFNELFKFAVGSYRFWIITIFLLIHIEFHPRCTRVAVLHDLQTHYCWKLHNHIAYDLEYYLIIYFALWSNCG